MAETNPLKAQVSEGAYPLEPFLYTLPDGQSAGTMFSDRQWQPGTDEYELRKNPQFRAVNRSLFQMFEKADTPLPQTQLGGDFSVTDDISRGPIADFYNNIKANLPEGKKSTEEAAWFTINTLRPQANHDAKYVFGKIRPVIEAKMAEAEAAGTTFYPADLQTKEILEIAAAAGVDQSIIRKMMGEEAESFARKTTKTYTMGYLKPMVDNLDVNSKWGEMVFNDPERYLFGQPPEVRRDAFNAMARWKDKHGVNFGFSVIEGLSTLIGEAGYAAGGFVEGSIGTLVAVGSEGSIVMENGRSVLSDRWIAKSREERDEANGVLIRAHELAKKYGPELIEANDDQGKFIAVLQRRFGKYADPDELNTFKRLAELRQQGAYRPQMSYERLANFGEGILKAIPSLVGLVSESTDPGALFFHLEYQMKNMGSVFGAGVDAWIRSSDMYKDMSAAHLDSYIDQWENNWREQRGTGESVTGWMYRQVGATDLARHAESTLQEKRLIDAAALADPVLVFMGALKLAGVGAKAAEAAKTMSAVRSGLGEVAAEAARLRAGANVTSDAFNGAVAKMRAELEALVPGATFTDDDVIGIALGDRKSRIGQTPSAQVIRKEIGSTISKNKSLSTRVQELQKQLDALPDDAAGIDKLRSRPAFGAVGAAAGATTSAAGKSINWIAEFLDEQSQSNLKAGAIRRGLSRAFKYALPNTSIAGKTIGAGVAGAYLIQGDIVGAALSGAGYVTFSQVLRPDTLRAIGSSVQQMGRIQSAVAKNISLGKQYGESTFIRTAIDLEEEARKITAGIPITPGVPLTKEQAAAMLKATNLADDAVALRRLQSSGWERALRSGSKVVWEDGVVAGVTGGILAAMADEDAAGAGVGMGIGFAGTLRTINRLYTMLPKGADPVNAKMVLGDVATILSDTKDMAQRANILEFLGRAGDDSAAYIQRANIIRDLHMAHRGNILFVKGTEFEAATILTQSPAAEAKMIMEEAAALHPGDPAKAKEYALQRKATLDKSRAAADRATALAGDSETNKVKIDGFSRDLKAIDAEIKAAEAVVEAEKIEWTDPKKVDANRIALDKLRQRRSEIETSMNIAIEQQTVIDGDLAAAKGESQVTAPMRPYESRAMPDGSTVRSAANGFYIVDGPQGRKTYINIDTIDNLGAISEGWHALLSDSAVQHLMPEMVDMMWGGGYTPDAVSWKVTDEILRAYAADLPAEQRARFMMDYQNGLSRFRDSGFTDRDGLIDPTREVMTWILASMDLRDRRTNYRPGLATPRGSEASAINFDVLKKTLFGDRTISDNASSLLKNLFDPTYGVFSRKHASGMVSQLEAAGMRFIESGDGTLRGYFLNSNNEIIRSPVLDAFYDKIIVATGGKGSNRIRPINLYDPMIPVENRIDFIKRNGLDWVLTDDGKGIRTPEEVGRLGDKFTRALEDALNSVPEDQRGMQVYIDPNGNPIRTGIPSAQEIAAINADTSIPETYKQNFLTILRTLASGESKEVLTAEYSNVFSVNTDALTEHRLRVGKDIAGKTENRSIVPLAFTMGEAPIYDANGKKIRVKGPDGKMVDATQRVVRLRVFDTKAFSGSVNQAFTQGLFTLDDAGKKVYLQDPSGNPYTANYIRSLFGSDAEFMNKATLWMRHYYKSGPLDPTAPTPKKPDGSPRDVNPVSAEVLDPVNPARGAAMRDALRGIFSLESGKKRLGWVEENRQTNMATGFAIRGTNFPISDLRLDQLGPLKPNGQSLYIDQIGLSSGTFAMSIKGWGSQKIPVINGVPTMTIKTVAEAGESRFLNGPELSVSEVRVHPSLPEVKLFIGYEKGVDGKQTKNLAYTVGDGRIIILNSADERRAVSAIREKVAAREDAAYIDSILKDWRENNNQVLAATQAEKPSAAAATRIYDPVRSQNEFMGAVDGVFAVAKGGKMPPSMREFLNELNFSAEFSEGRKDAQAILESAIEVSKNRHSWKSSGDKYRAITKHLEEARDLVRDQSWAQQEAYVVPTRDNSLKSINDTFRLGRDNADQRVAGRIFEFNKQFAPDQFANNKEYLEAFIGKLDEQLFDAASLEGDEFTKASKPLEEMKYTAEKALVRLKKNAPELWEAKPAAAAEAPVALTAEQRAKLNKPFDEIAVNRTSWQDDAMVVANGYNPQTDTNFPLTQVGNNFQAHGMTKQVGPNTALKAVIKMFSDGIDTTNKDFFTAPYRLPEGTTSTERAGLGAGLGTGGGEAWKEGPITIVGKYGADINSINDVGFVVVNDGAFTNPDAAVAILRERLPDNVKVIKMSEEAQHLVKPSEAAPAAPDAPLTQRQLPDVPEMTPDEVARTRELRVDANGNITRVPMKVVEEQTRLRQRFEALLKQRQQQVRDTQTALDRQQRIFIAEQNRRYADIVASEERFAAQARRRAQQEAQRDAKAAAEAQREADRAQARADAARIAFEKGIEAQRAKETVKREQTAKLLDLALSSSQPLISPGLLLVDIDRMPIAVERKPVVTDTVSTPSVTTRSNIVYLRNWSGFEAQTQAFQQAFFNYLHGAEIGKGKAIATQAFQGPMAAQQGINLINSRMWVAENSGARLLREYKNADKAAGRDIVTYKVYGANGTMIKTTNDAQDAVEAIENLERRFQSTLGIGVRKKLDAIGIGEAAASLVEGIESEPATQRRRPGNVSLQEQRTMRIPGVERYLPMSPKTDR